MKKAKIVVLLIILAISVGIVIVLLSMWLTGKKRKPIRVLPTSSQYYTTNMTTKSKETGTLVTLPVTSEVTTMPATTTSLMTVTMPATLPVTDISLETQMPADPGHTVYLTFDDGPSGLTEKLLDILDRYNVKATFFVTNQFPDYRNMIAEESRRGHTVGIHSFCHDFRTIYSSVDSFKLDLTSMNNVIYEMTGKVPSIVRFGGGSSNTVSKVYKPGIMTELVSLMPKWGYRYFDWNVYGGDAGETTDTNVVADTIIKGIKANTNFPSFVLQHDYAEFTVDAVEKIIQWGIENGYTFLPITDKTPDCHHSVFN